MLKELKYYKYVIYNQYLNVTDEMVFIWISLKKYSYN